MATRYRFPFLGHTGRGNHKIRIDATYDKYLFHLIASFYFVIFLLSSRIA
jgi:hypothetical protein